VRIINNNNNNDIANYNIVNYNNNNNNNNTRCDLGVFGDDLIGSCVNETLTIQDVFHEAIQSNPDVAFANLNSKADTSQMAFYR